MDIEITENEMVALFPVGEIDSPNTFGGHVRRWLSALEQPERLIRNPDLLSETENICRKNILSRYRGYPDDCLFKNYPSGNVRWFRRKLDRDEISQVRPLFPKKIEQCVGLVRELEERRTLPGTIFLIAQNVKGPYFVLEGNHRFSALIHVDVGVSPDVMPWIQALQKIQ